MKPTIVRRRGRALASLTATMGLCLGAASVVSAPAQSAEPAGDCAARVLSASSRATRSRGSPSPASARAPRRRGSPVRCSGSSTTASRPTWTWSWSGSRRRRSTGSAGSGRACPVRPVYGPDGELIGAVAYGLSFGPSPVAGVTPFVDMASYLGPAPATRGGRQRPGRPGDRAEQRRDRSPGRAGLRAAADADRGVRGRSAPTGPGGPAGRRRTGGCRRRRTGWEPPRRPVTQRPVPRRSWPVATSRRRCPTGTSRRGASAPPPRCATARWSASGTR